MPHKAKPCIHLWVYQHALAGTCSYKFCLRCSLVIFFAKKGCKG